MPEAELFLSNMEDACKKKLLYPKIARR